MISETGAELIINNINGFLLSLITMKETKGWELTFWQYQAYLLAMRTSSVTYKGAYWHIMNRKLRSELMIRLKDIAGLKSKEIIKKHGVGALILDIIFSSSFIINNLIFKSTILLS